MFFMPAKARFGKLAVAAALLAAIAAASGAGAAPRDAAGPGGIESPGTSRVDPTVRKVQELLRGRGAYDGPADGVNGAATRAAIRAFQRGAGLPETGTADERLVRRLELDAGVEELMSRLDRARQDAVQAARAALLGQAATRDLMAAKNEVANPVRNPSACFAAPEPVCLLAEAVESAKAVTVADRRDWAFGEILVVQARAGLLAEARESVRHIGDPRLVMVALRDIALAEARRMRHDDAAAAAAIIPDSLRRAETFAEMASIQAPRAPAVAIASARRAVAEAAAVSDAVQAAAVTVKAARAVATAGDPEAARGILDKARKRTETEAAAKASLATVAAAYADIGQPEEAMSLAARLESGDEKTSVLMAAAAAMAQAGRDGATRTALSIKAARYRAASLARVAELKARRGDAGGARDALAAAAKAQQEIDLVFARDVARAAIARASAVLDGPPDWAQAEGIGEARLRAETLWVVARERAGRGEAGVAAEGRERARRAMAAIPVPLSRLWLLCDVVETEAREGSLDLAGALWREGLTEARGIGNVWVRSRGLARLAQSLVMLSEAEAIPTGRPALSGPR